MWFSKYMHMSQHRPMCINWSPLYDTLCVIYPLILKLVWSSNTQKSHTNYNLSHTYNYYSSFWYNIIIPNVNEYLLKTKDRKCVVFFFLELMHLFYFSVFLTYSIRINYIKVLVTCNSDNLLHVVPILNVKYNISSELVWNNSEACMCVKCILLKALA